MKQQIIQGLNWRYATKEFDTSKKLNKEELDFVKETMRLAPSSYGIQAWKFVEIKDPEIRAKLVGLGWGQKQYTEASNLFAFCTYLNPNSKSQELVQKYIDDIAKERGVSKESLNDYKDMMVNAVNNGNTTGDPEYTPFWLDNQLYLALGQTIAACAIAGIDTCPMEGFEIAKTNELLGLQKMGLQVKCFLAVGFRNPQDKYANMEKVRFDTEELFIEI